MTFRIADTFSDSLSRLTSQEQKAVKTVAFDLQMNPDTPGLQMHRVEKARDPHFWTARVNRDIRMVLHKQEGATLLAYVAHHDAAYKWAETRRIDTHPRTGAAQIVEIRETVEEVIIQHYVQEAVRMPRLFEHEGDETLLSWGIPQDWLDTVRQATEDTVLDIAGRLPGEAGEALLQAATGVRPSMALVQRGGDPFAHPDAGRRFRTMENLDELRAALEAPWEKWSVYLHPAQREFVERDFNGSARVIGSAGTGKTVVALHRAIRLAKAQTSRVLLTTFNTTLAARLAEKLPLLAEQDVVERIEVRSLGEIISELYRQTFGEPALVADEDVRSLLQIVAHRQGVQFDPDFLWDEWSLIIDAWDIREAALYRELPRLGRKVRLAVARRDTLWKVFDEVRAELATKGMVTEAGMAHALRVQGTLPFTNVVVDEAQDISVAELMLLGDALGDLTNGLFFSGDIGQRIFRAPFPWSAAGIELRGRSRSLKVNYRTSHQIRVESDKLLPEKLVEADGSEDNRTGVTSIFEGPGPVIQSFSNRDKELAGLAEWLEAVIAQGVAADQIAILTRHADMLGDLSDQFPAGCNILAMHEAKGSEFRAVAVLALDQDVLPDNHRVLMAQDEAQLDEILATERHLLYVAATRARDHLWMSGVEPLSEFLVDLMQN